MEKSSLDYREKLYSQIQEEYGKLVYTYTCLHVILRWLIG